MDTYSKASKSQIVKYSKKDAEVARRVRDKLRLTRKEMAKAMCCSEVSIKRFEKKDNIPRGHIAEMYRIIEVLIEFSSKNGLSVTETSEFLKEFTVSEFAKELVLGG